MKKIIIRLSLLSIIIFITGCNLQRNNNFIDSKKDDSNEVINSVKLLLNGKEFEINLESNETAKSFVSILPQEFIMSDLNDNEKYVYLDEAFKTNPTNVEYINSGDVMIYGNNCLVIFYKSFKTTYSYTKIGHIDNLPDLENGNIKVQIKK